MRLDFCSEPPSTTAWTKSVLGRRTTGPTVVAFCPHSGLISVEMWGAWLAAVRGRSRAVGTSPLGHLTSLLLGPPRSCSGTEDVTTFNINVLASAEVPNTRPPAMNSPSLSSHFAVRFRLALAFDLSAYHTIYRRTHGDRGCRRPSSSNRPTNALCPSGRGFGLAADADGEAVSKSNPTTPSTCVGLSASLHRSRPPLPSPVCAAGLILFFCAGCQPRTCSRLSRPSMRKPVLLAPTRIGTQLVL